MDCDLTASPENQNKISRANRILQQFSHRTSLSLLYAEPYKQATRRTE